MAGRKVGERPGLDYVPQGDGRSLGGGVCRRGISKTLSAWRQEARGRATKAQEDLSAKQLQPGT